jgi:hypothetical protein
MPSPDIGSNPLADLGRDARILPIPVLGPEKFPNISAGFCPARPERIAAQGHFPGRRPGHPRPQPARTRCPAAFGSAAALRRSGHLPGFSGPPRRHDASPGLVRGKPPRTADPGAPRGRLPGCSVADRKNALDAVPVTFRQVSPLGHRAGPAIRAAWSHPATRAPGRKPSPHCGGSRGHRTGREQRQQRLPDRSRDRWWHGVADQMVDVGVSQTGPVPRIGKTLEPG